MDYRRGKTDTRQPSPQQPHTARGAREVAAARTARTTHGARPTALPMVYGQPAPPTVPMHPPTAPRALSTARPTPDLGVNSVAYDPALSERPYDYTTPIILDAVAFNMTLEAFTDEETERLKTANDLAMLLKRWLRWPTFDPEYEPGFEQWAGELAAWHDAQLKRKAKLLGCSVLMANILEHLVKCFIYDRPPDGPLARRLLHEYE